MFRLLFTRRWLAWLAVAAIWATACLFLGRWQWHRWQSKHTLQEQMDHNYNATPVGIRSVLPAGTTGVDDATEWRQVRLVGHYEAKHRVLVRNRPNNGNYGYEVVVPFALKQGGNVLVDRGWIPNGPTAAAPASVPATPAGAVSVTGWVRPLEANLHKAPVAGQVSSINSGEIRQMTGVASAFPAYVQMRHEKTASGATPDRPQALPEPDPGHYAGINLSYAIQWWFGMVAGFAVVLLRARREHLDATRGPRPAKPKKVRIWDEEDA